MLLLSSLWINNNICILLYLLFVLYLLYFCIIFIDSWLCWNLWWLSFYSCIYRLTDLNFWNWLILIIDGLLLVILRLESLTLNCWNSILSWLVIAIINNRLLLLNYFYFILMSLVLRLTSSLNNRLLSFYLLYNLLSFWWLVDLRNILWCCFRLLYYFGLLNWVLCICCFLCLI